MKKTRLLTSMLTLALALSVGACSENEEEDEEVSETEYSESSGETSTTEQDLEEEDSSQESSENKKPKIEVDPATDPASFIDNACSTGNYSIQLIVDEYVSDTLTYEDAYEENFDADELIAGMVETEYGLNIYYTEDAILIEYGYLIGYYFILIEADLFVNTKTGNRDKMISYYSYDEVTWTKYKDYTYYKWTDFFYSLFDNPTYMQLEASDFRYVETDTDSSGDTYEVYGFSSDYANYAFGFLIGIDAYDPNLIGYAQAIDYLYFYPDYQELYATYYSSVWYFTDSSYSYVHLVRDTYYSLIHNVGETDIDDVVAYVTA